MILLAGLLFQPLELVERAFPRLVEQAELEVDGQLDREHAKVALVVELDRGMARRSRRLLVCGEQCVLECVDERPALDSLLAFDVANGINDFLAHCLPHPSSIKFARTIRSYGMSTGSEPFRICTACSPAATTSPLKRSSSVFSRTV